MESIACTQQDNRLIVTLEDSAAVSEVRKAILMIRGIASVRRARISDDKTISPTLRRRINAARVESSRGETMVCHTPEEMQQYFDSL